MSGMEIVRNITMKLPPGVFRYLLVGQAVIPFFINLAVNAFLGMLAYRGQDTVMTWALDKGAVADSVGTCFFLPFITCLIATPIVRHQAGRGTVAHIPLADVPRWTQLMSGQLVLRAVRFGVVGIVVFAGPVYVAYNLFAGESIQTTRFIAIKAVFAAVLGILATPLIAYVAMCDKPAT